MDDSIGSTIKKIKLQEEDNYAKLKGNRELEEMITNLRRNIRDSISTKEKSLTEQKELTSTTTKLRSQLQIEKIRQQALNSQIDELKKECNDLRLKCDQEISNVWNMRSYFCDDIHKKSDQYDIWALLVKPLFTKILPTPLKSNGNTSIVLTNEKRLQCAREKLEKVIAERDRLKSEPDIDEEFIRIKNALQYSLQSIEALKKKQYKKII